MDCGFLGVVLKALAVVEVAIVVPGQGKRETEAALGAVAGQTTTRMRMVTMAVETMAMMIFVAICTGEMAMNPY